MAERGLGKALLDIGRSREGRVHQHDCGADFRRETVVDLLRVVPGHGRCVAEEATEEPGAGLRDLVEKQPRAGELGKDRQEPCSGGGFEDQVGRGQRCRLGGDEAERDRR
jgi:hypothetical protein